MMRKKSFLPPRAVFFGAFTALCLCYILSFLPRFPLESSVLSLLPPLVSDNVDPKINEAFAARLDTQAVVLVSSKDADRAAKAADFVSQRLNRLPHVKSVTAKFTEERKNAYAKAFFDFKEAMISDEVRERLASGGASSYVLSQLFSGFLGVGASELANDPLLLTRQLQSAGFGSSNSRLGLCGDFLCASYEGQTWYFLHLTFDEEARGITAAQQIALAFDNLRDDLQKEDPNALMYQRGAVFYTAEAAAMSEHDITLLGSATIIILLAVMAFAYRSAIPLLAVVLSIVSAAVIATAAVLLCFGSIHTFTLLVGLSTAGLCCDYTLYYFTLHLSLKQTPKESLTKVQKVLVIAFATTAVSYLIMLTAPFPGVMQMAVFCVCALGGALLFVLSCEPYLASLMRPYKDTGLDLLGSIMRFYTSRVKVMLTVVAALSGLAGLVFLEFDDDVKNFAVMPYKLQYHDEMVSNITGQSADQKWLLLTSPSDDLLLDLNDRVKGILKKAEKAGVITGFRAIPLNSYEVQLQDAALIKKEALQIVKTLDEAGVKIGKIRSPQSLKELYKGEILTLDEYLSSPLALGFSLSVIVTYDKASLVIPLEGLSDKKALEDLISGIEGCYLIDRKADFDHIFASYRYFLSWLTLGALGVILLTMVLRLGFKEGTKAFLPSLLSVGCALAASLLWGHKVNFFVILALIVVLGVGINYSLFFGNRLTNSAHAFAAVTLAMITTECTLGILALSSVQAVSSFGWTLLVGVFSAFVLSPLAVPKESLQVSSKNNRSSLS